MMLLLLYCMAEPGNMDVPPRGVRDAAVEVIQHAGLACYFSRYEDFAGGSADELKQDALAFHWTVNHVFQRQTVIPFRFPTLLPGTADLEAFLAKNAAGYHADLARLRGAVQMEIRMTQAAAPAPPSGGSGTAYLKAKFDAAQKVIELEQLIKSAAQAEWRQRANRYFALIPRGAVEEFRDKIADLGHASLRVSGPWPPAEFVDCYPDAGLEKG